MLIKNVAEQTLTDKGAQCTDRGTKRKYDLVVDSDEEETSWDLPEELNSFFSKHCQVFMPKKKRKALIFDKHKCQPPENLQHPPKIDGYISTNFQTSGMGKKLSEDKEMCDGFEQTSAIMGPLGKAWLTVENFRSDPSEANQIDIDELGVQLKLAVMMVGQACHKITHQRRLSALRALAEDQGTAESLLKQNSDCLEKEGKRLFGEEFQKVLKTSTKESKVTKEYFDHLKDLKGKNKNKATKQNKGNKGKGAPGNGSFSGSTYVSPFRGGSHHNTGYTRGGGTFNRGGTNTKPYSSNRGGFKGGYGSPWKSSGKKSIIYKFNAFSTPKGSGSPIYNINANSTKWGGKLVEWGENLVLPKQLEEADRGQSDIGNSSGIQNPSNPNTSSSKKSPCNIHGCTQTTGCVKRNKKHAFKRGSHSDNPGTGSVFKQRVCPSEKRRKTQNDIKPETIERLCQVPPFQNGGTERHKAHSAGRRLSPENRPPGCFLERSSESTITKADAIRMGRNPIRVQNPCFWPRPSPMGLHQTDEDSSLFDETSGDKGDGLFGRHTRCHKDLNRSLPGQGHLDLPSGKSGLNGELEKVHHQPSPLIGVFGNDNRHRVNVDLSPSEKNRCHSDSLQGKTCKECTYSEGNESTSRKAVFNSPCNSSSSSATEVLTTGPHKSTERRSDLHRHLEDLKEFPRGIKVVDFQPGAAEGNAHSAPGARNGDILRCCGHAGLGCSHGRGSFDRGTMVSRGEDHVPYKCSRATSSRTGHKIICENKTSVKSTHLDRQPGSFVISDENGGNQKRNINLHFQKDLEIPSGSRDHTHCRVDPIQIELESRPGVEAKTQFQRMDALAGNLLANCPEVGHSNSGLLRLAHNETIGQLHESSPRSRKQGDKCHVSAMAQRVPLSISSLLPDRTVPEEAEAGEGGTSHSGSPTVARANMVSKPSGNVCGPSCSVTKQAKHSDKCGGSTSSFGRKSNPQSGSIPGLRESLEARGISGRATTLLLGSKRESTANIYSGHWAKWSSWCSERETDPFTCHLNFVLDYLAALYEKGLKYRTIGVVRSAISAHHVAVEGFCIGDHPLVRKLISGVGIKLPPQPKYCVIWDVEKVLDFFRKLPNDAELSLQTLTHKTAMLLALAAVSRGSELKMLDTRFLAVSETKLVFWFAQPPKNCRKKGVSPKPLEILTSGMSLCPVRTTRHYITRTIIHRGDNTPLFIGTVKPHKPVTRSTIGRWLKEVLKQVGVNIEAFQSHSTRSASSSGAFTRGASIQDILDRGNWSNESTWQRFYNKHIINANARYQNALFSEQS